MRSALGYLILSILFAAALIINSEFVITLLFGGGEFGAQSVAAVKGIFDILVVSIAATTLIWVLKLPSITGPHRVALPISELLVWTGLFALLQFPLVSVNVDLMIMLLVASYWTRVLIACVIIASQISGQRRVEQAA